MTLIMSIPCQEGMVICADKRTTYIAFMTITKDNTEKIKQTGKNMAFVTIGCPNITLHYYDDETFEMMEGKSEVYFDSDAMIEKFFKSFSPEYIEHNHQSLIKKIEESFQKGIVDAGREGDATFASPPEYLQFQTLFFAADKTEGIRMYSLVATYKHPDDPKFKLAFKRLDPDPFALKPMAYGYSYIIKEIESGSAASFDTYRKNPLIKRLLIDLDYPSNITLHDALQLAREIFAITYKRYRDVKSPLTEDQLKESPISKTIDCAIISPGTGFRWLERNVSVVED